MSRVLFVFPILEAYTPEKPLTNFTHGSAGVSLISAVLRVQGHETEAFAAGHNHLAAGHRLLEQAIARFKPDIAGFSLMAPTFGDGVELARGVRGRHPELYLAAGGAHVSLNPEAALAAGFDAACVGEGEYPVLELVEQLGRGARPHGIPNLWLRDGSRIEKNPTRPFLQNLDALPAADQGIWAGLVDPEMLALQARVGLPTVTLLLGRGCPFSCTYCSNQALSKLASGCYVRVRSPDAIIAELRLLSQLHPGVNSVYLEVETIAAKQEWALELCKRLEAFNGQRAAPLAFGCNLRVTPNLRAEELFAAMQAANFKFVTIGLESGSERVRKEILCRHYSNDDVTNTVAAARRHGLRVVFQNLIGLPGESLADFQETVRMNRLCAPDDYFLSIFEPYPGTELHRLCQEKGYLPKVQSSPFGRMRAQLDLPGFPRARIQHCYNWFDYHVLKGRIPYFRLLLRLGTRWLRSSRLLFALHHCKPLIRFLRVLKLRLTKH